MITLHKFLRLRDFAMRIKWWYCVKIWGMDIDPTAKFSLSVKFDKTFPKGIHVGKETYIAFDVAILAHDMTRGLYTHTRIGDSCFIGARSIILPGVTIGNGCIIGSGSVVTKDIPAGSIAAGNPAQIMRSEVELHSYGRFPNALQNTRAAAARGDLGRRRQLRAKRQ